MKKIVLSTLALLVLSGCSSTNEQQQINKLTQRITNLETNQRLLASSVKQPNLVSMPETIAFSDGIAFGDPKAPLALVEFTDIQCPYCAKFQANTFPDFKKKYIDTGMVYYVARELPLVSMHSQAVPAAVALRCTAEQNINAYEPMKEALFAIGSKLTTDSYAQEAEKLMLDGDKFTTCMSDKIQLKSVNESYKYAASVGLNSTPAFVIGNNTGLEISNFKVMKGALTLENLDEAIALFSEK